MNDILLDMQCWRAFGREYTALSREQRRILRGELRVSGRDEDIGAFTLRDEIGAGNLMLFVAFVITQ